MKKPPKTIIKIIFVITLFSILFSYSESNSSNNYFSYSLDVYLPYSWNEKSLRVATLQQSLGLNITGIYDSTTRLRHIDYLRLLGAPTNNVPLAPSEKPTNEIICAASVARQFAHQILDPYGIPIPSITVVSNAKSSFYGPGSGAIIMPPCETKSVLAHEIGHYIHARAFNFDWSAATQDAIINFTSSDWIAAQEITPGIEHAAHCIGNVLWGYGPYTKCPDYIMKTYAKKIVQMARN